MAKDFDPKEVSAIAAGHTIQGYADGTFASFAKNKENAKKTYTCHIY